MKTPMQDTLNGKQTATLLVAGLILAGISIDAIAADSGVPMCAKFVGATNLIRNDDNPTQMYCDSENDVLAASTGGFGFTTDYRKGPRQVFVDLQSATLVQVDNPVLAATLPKGHVEFTLHQLHHVGLYEVPFKLVFTKEPLGAVLNLIN